MTDLNTFLGSRCDDVLAAFGLGLSLTPVVLCLLAWLRVCTNLVVVVVFCVDRLLLLLLRHVCSWLGPEVIVGGWLHVRSFLLEQSSLASEEVDIPFASEQNQGELTARGSFVRHGARTR